MESEGIVEVGRRKSQIGERIVGVGRNEGWKRDQMGSKSCCA